MHISTVMIHRTGCSIENTEHEGLRPRACSLCFFAFRTLLRAVQDGNIPPKSNHPTNHWPRMEFLQQLHCSTWVRKGDGAFCGMWDDFICRSGVVFPVTRANPTADPCYPLPWCLEHQRVRVVRWGEMKWGEVAGCRPRRTDQGEREEGDQENKKITQTPSIME